MLCFIIGTTNAQAASNAVSGKAKVANTSTYLDFTNYSSNATVDNTTGNFSGYGWLEDLGWVTFGTTDNSEGPVNVSIATGAVTGKAKVLATGAYLDFYQLWEQCKRHACHRRFYRFCLVRRFGLD